MNSPSLDRMVWIPSGQFIMGSNKHYPEERPVRTIRVQDFWIDRYPVTNEQFHAFVEATGYITLAERWPNPEHYPGIDSSNLRPGSLVFKKPAQPVPLNDHRAWWAYLHGASWKHPEGPDSTIDNRGNHPAVHIAFEDAVAYCRWSGKDLPTEAEWEYAARGGIEGAEFTWGDEPTPGGRFMANTWQGEFPWQNLKNDGYEGTSPVGAYQANGYGLYDMAGNVWEWTRDLFTPDHRSSAKSPCCTPEITGINSKKSKFQAAIREIPRRVVKGGSHLCSPNYCFRFRPAARQGEAVDTSAAHIGFRCVVRSPGELTESRGTSD